MRLTVIIVLIVVLIGGVMVWTSQNRTKSSTIVPSRTSSQPTQNTDSSGQMGLYEGELLSGTSSPYLSFTQAGYEQARRQEKIIFLDFYANWCPICRAESPEIFAGFNELSADNVVGFRVNYKDDETDEYEKALAEQFDIPYQHTKVVIKNGKEVLRSSDQWDKETFLSEISSLL